MQLSRRTVAFSIDLAVVDRRIAIDPESDGPVTSCFYQQHIGATRPNLRSRGLVLILAPVPIPEFPGGQLNRGRRRS